MGYDSPAEFAKFCSCSARSKNEYANVVGIARMIRRRLNL